MSWPEYVKQHSRGDTQDQIATACGVKGSTVSRWVAGTSGVDPRQAAAFARHYGRPVLEAFVAAGFLSPMEAKARPASQVDVGSLTNTELLREVEARMREEVVGRAAPMTPRDPKPPTLSRVRIGVYDANYTGRKASKRGIKKDGLEPTPGS